MGYHTQFEETDHPECIITTGFTRDRIVEMCALVDARSEDAGGALWPPILGLFDAVVVTLTYLRRNRVQAELAEAFGVSQSTISQAVTALTSVLGPCGPCGSWLPGIVLYELSLSIS